MRSWVLFILLSALVRVSQAQYEFILDSALLPVGHGDPSMTVCIQRQNGFNECTDLEFVLDPETGLYHGVASFVCEPAWLTSITATMECRCETQSMMYAFAPFTMPFICDLFSPGETGYEEFFQFADDCTCAIGDLTIRHESGHLHFNWSRANGSPVYHLMGYFSPYDSLEAGILMTNTPDTSLILPARPDLPRFYRVTAVYSDGRDEALEGDSLTGNCQTIRERGEP